LSFGKARVPNTDILNELDAHLTINPLLYLYSSKYSQVNLNPFSSPTPYYNGAKCNNDYKRNL